MPFGKEVKDELVKRIDGKSLKIMIFADAHVPSQHGLDLPFGPLYDEFFTACTSSVNKSFSPTNNSNQQDTQPTTNIQPTSEPSTPIYVHVEENNNNQAEEEHLQDNEFTNPFCTLVRIMLKMLKISQKPGNIEHKIGSLHGPYKPTTVVVQAVAVTDDSPAVPEHTTVETPMNMSPANKAHFESEKEEMGEAIERLQQGESLNIQYVKTNLFWEFGKFTSHDGETMESYYARFYKMMNEMIRNNLTVATMQVNVKFLQQLQPKWSRFVTIVKQQHKLDEVSYHKLFDILKQYQKEVNKLPSEEDNDPEQAQRDKDMQKNLALIAKYFKKIYKPTNNNLRTSSNSRNKNVDTTSRENVGNLVVQQSGIQCFNYKEFGHFAKECRKPKRVKDSVYHKEKMLLCKQAEKGVLLQAEQYDWLADTDKEIDEQELEAHYSYMAKI
nr:hypothetical protein [Tanacetum cinerariifolium]